MDYSTPINVQQEAEYVMGLADMYKHDFEIENVLKRKGLTDMQIVEVMDYVRMKFYQKRMRQGLKIMWIGIAIAVVTGAAWAYFMGAFERDFDFENLVYIFASDNDNPGGVFIMYLGYAFIFGIVWTILGASKYIVYFKKSNS